MRAIVAFINNFSIVLRKVLGVSFKLKALNFFYLFMIFRMSFLITYGSDFVTYPYLKPFISLRFVCDFSGKKLHYSIFAFFYIIKAACYLEQSLDSIIILEQ